MSRLPVTTKKNNSFLVKHLHIVVTIIFYLRDVTLNIFKINRFLSKILTGKAKLGLMTSYILFTMLLFPEIMIFHFFCWWKQCSYWFDRNKLKNSHREKAPSNKTQAFTKSVNMDIWVVGTSNQLFIRGS